MSAVTIVKALGMGDARSIGRDPLLRAMAVVPLGLAVAAQWVFPPAVARISALLQVDLVSPYAQLMAYVLLLLAPIICGIVVGFLLLDQVDDHTLRALQVTPLSLHDYLAYRLITPMLLSLVITLTALPLSGLTQVSGWALLLVTVATAPMAPLLALFLASFAANKVQGLALQKALGVLLVLPAISIYLPTSWRAVVGILPTYWPATVLWTLQTGSSHIWAPLLIGLAYQLLLIGLLLRRFTAVMYR